MDRIRTYSYDGRTICTYSYDGCTVMYTYVNVPVEYKI